MSTVTAGRGTGDSVDYNRSGWLLVDRYYPASGKFTVTQIKILFYSISAGADLPVGCGTLSGTTFTPRTHVHFNTTGWAARFPSNLATLTAPDDFTAFTMYAGDLVYGYWNSDALGLTTAADPEGYGYQGADVHGASSFQVALNSTYTMEIEFSGDSVAPKGGKILTMGVG